MSVLLRPAAAGDVDALVAVKAALRVPADGLARAGGFLLGASREGYALLIEHAQVTVLAEPGGAVGGFAIALPDAVLRASDVWARRALIRWDRPGALPPDDARVGYFDQLATLPVRRFRVHAPALALATLGGLLRSGHEHVFATAVREPVPNPAAVPLLLAAGFRPVGAVEESYPEVGRVLSDVYALRTSAAALDAHAQAQPLGRRLLRSLARLQPATGA